MISSQPTLRNTWLIILHNMRMVTDEQESSIVLQVQLQSNQPIGVTGEVVKRDTLGEINSAIVEGLPVELVNAEVVREVYASIGTGCTGEEGRFEFTFVNPDGDVCFAEVLEASGVVKVKMADDDLFDVFDVVSCLGYGCFELVFGRVVVAGEDVVQGGSPDLCSTAMQDRLVRQVMRSRRGMSGEGVLTRVVLSTTSLPKDKAFGGVLDEDRVHDEVTSFRFGGSLWVGHERGIASTTEPAGIGLEVAQANDVGFGALGSSVEHMRQYDAVARLVLGVVRHNDTGYEQEFGRGFDALSW